MAQGERLVSLYGFAFTTDADPATDQFVPNFLNAQANVDALGVDDAVLELKDSITIRPVCRLKQRFFVGTRAELRLTTKLRSLSSPKNRA